MSHLSIYSPFLDRSSTRRSVRRFRWFRQAITMQMNAISEEMCIEFQLNPESLRIAFLHWIKKFDASKPNNKDFRQAYVGFASGLMLCELIKAEPFLVTKIPVQGDQNKPAYFWPEGYAYVTFCLNMRLTVLEQDFNFQTEISPKFEDIATWWSFKENVSIDISRAIGFLDLFSSTTPNWNLPSVFSANRVGAMTLGDNKRQNKIIGK